MAEPKTVHRIVVEVRENEFGDRDIHIDESGAFRYELVGMLTDAIHELQLRYPSTT